MSGSISASISASTGPQSTTNGLEQKSMKVEEEQLVEAAQEGGA